MRQLLGKAKEQKRKRKQNIAALPINITKNLAAYQRKHLDFKNPIGLLPSG